MASSPVVGHLGHHAKANTKKIPSTLTVVLAKGGGHLFANSFMLR